MNVAKWKPRIIPRFHIAFPVNNLKSTKDFFTKVLGCSLGRESDKWIDFNMYGHQVVAHFSPEDCIKSNVNKVDGDMVSCRHFGVILPWDNWEKLGERTKLTRFFDCLPIWQLGGSR